MNEQESQRMEGEIENGDLNHSYSTYTVNTWHWVRVMHLGPSPTLGRFEDDGPLSKRPRDWPRQALTGYLGQATRGG